MSWLGTYILEGKRAVRCDNMLEWAMWLELNVRERQVALTQIGECVVSTVFLGMDHNFMGDGGPLLFETMAFGPEAVKEWNGKPHTYRPEICSMNRYESWELAELGHKVIVGEVEQYVLDTAVKAEEAIMAIAARV